MTQTLTTNVTPMSESDELHIDDLTHRNRRPNPASALHQRVLSYNGERIPKRAALLAIFLLLIGVTFTSAGLGLYFDQGIHEAMPFLIIGGICTSLTLLLMKCLYVFYACRHACVYVCVYACNMRALASPLTSTRVLAKILHADRSLSILHASMCLITATQPSFQVPIIPQFCIGPGVGIGVFRFRNSRRINSAAPSFWFVIYSMVEF
jgi:hypothetical protein